MSMRDTRQFNHVIVGSGPCAATVLDELIDHGIEPGDILLVTIPFKSRVRKVAQKDIFLRSKEIREEGKLSKGLESDLSLPNEIVSPGEIWGTSCLPYSEHWKSMEEFEGLKEAYHLTAVKWGVQANRSFQNSDKEYIYTGEEVGSLKRKHLAEKIVSKGRGFQHSRLALKSQKDDATCSQKSSCFTGCPTDIPYRPSAEILKLKASHDFTYIQGEVKQFERESKTLLLTDGSSFRYRNLYLSAGCTGTLDILRRSDETFAKYNYFTSSAILLPFFSMRRASDTDFLHSFLFHDLIFSVSKLGKQIGMVQLYLPTHEISSRILSTLPKALTSFLNLFPKITTVILRHVGIAMIFVPGNAQKDTRKSLRFTLKPIVRQLRIALGKGGIILMSRPSEYLLNEESMHIGALGFVDNVRGLNDAGIMQLSKRGVFICDTSLLPDLPPGPPTALASAFVRLIVRAAIVR
jgi:hypothetical protein